MYLSAFGIKINVFTVYVEQYLLSFIFFGKVCVELVLFLLNTVYILHDSFHMKFYDMRS